MGYFALYDDTAVSPGCGDAWPTSMLVGNDGIQAPDAMCTCKPCAVTGQQCQLTGSADSRTKFMGDTDIATVFDAPCGSTSTCLGPYPVPPGWNGACSGLASYASNVTKCGAGSDCVTTGTQPCNQSVEVGAIQVTGGTCGAPPTPTKVLPAVTWTNNAEACGGAMPGTGCNTGHACLPSPQGAFVQGTCIMQSGEVPCPAGFTHQHIVYDPSQTADGRTCGNCTCGAVTGGTCSATVTVYSDNPSVCGTPTLIATLTPTTAGGDCKNLTNNHATFGAVTGGTCAEGGGQPTGGATPGGATTFCCTQ
jgi:hypothetical protein